MFETVTCGELDNDRVLEPSKSGNEGASPTLLLTGDDTIDAGVLVSSPTRPPGQPVLQSDVHTGD